MSLEHYIANGGFLSFPLHSVAFEVVLELDLVVQAALKLTVTLPQNSGIKERHEPPLPSEEFSILCCNKPQNQMPALHAIIFGS